MNAHKLLINDDMDYRESCEGGSAPTIDDRIAHAISLGHDEALASSSAPPRDTNESTGTLFVSACVVAIIEPSIALGLGYLVAK